MSESSRERAEFAKQYDKWLLTGESLDPSVPLSICRAALMAVLDEKKTAKESK